MGIAFKQTVVSSSIFLILASSPFKVAAQSSPSEGVTIPLTAPEIIEQTLPRPSDSPLPAEPQPSKPEPQLQTPVTPRPSSEPPPTRESLPIERVELWGSTVLQTEIIEKINSNEFENLEAAEIICDLSIPDSNLQDPNSQSEKYCIIQAQVNEKGISFEDLLELRSAITQLYIENYYITSGAFLPVNQVLEEVVRIQIVEGELEDIEIIGLNRLQSGYVRRRLELATDPPLNRKKLLEALQLLQLNPLLKQVNAELLPGSTSGRNILRLELREATAFHAGVALANDRSPSIGSLRGNLFLAHDNVLGFGDRFNFKYDLTEGLDFYELSYAIPVNPRDGRLSVRYSNNHNEIVEDDFRKLDISSEAETLSFSFRQPIFKSPESELVLGLTLDIRHSQTFLLDEPFSFSVGPEDGEANVTVLRFSQDWVDRTPRQILAARSEFSFGIDAFDATINDTGTDGRFFTWRGQFQYVKQFPTRFLLLGGINAQLTPDSLLSLERITVGGIDTVRGYRQSQFVTDNGIVGSLEGRFPLVSSSNHQLQLTSFFDFGTVWNNDDPDPKTSTIASLGTGLRWQIGSDFALRLDYGIPLVEVDNQGDSLQEDGFHFSLRFQPF